MRLHFFFIINSNGKSIIIFRFQLKRLSWKSFHSIIYLFQSKNSILFLLNFFQHKPVKIRYGFYKYPTAVHIPQLVTSRVWRKRCTGLLLLFVLTRGNFIPPLYCCADSSPHKLCRVCCDLRLLKLPVIRLITNPQSIDFN